MTRPQSTESLRSYYDRNTKRFLRFGGGKNSGAIHRALRAPGVRDREHAVNYVNELVAAEIGRCAAECASAEPAWLDLGCGVGGTIEYVYSKVPGRYAGVTISAVQRSLAERRFRDGRFGVLPAIVEGDFCSREVIAGACRALLPEAAGPGLDGAYMIESFVHASDAAELFRLLGGSLKPGGMLVICDDFLTAAGLRRLVGSQPPDRQGRSQRRLMQEFRSGWHADTLLTVNGAADHAARAGLVLERDNDLTAYVELERVRDRLIRLMVAIGRRLPLQGSRWESLLGGNALQHCLKRGLVSYRLLVFRKEQ